MITTESTKTKPKPAQSALKEYQKSSAASQSLIRCIQEIVESAATEATAEQDDRNLDAHFQELLLLFLQLKHSQRQLGALSQSSDTSTRRLHDQRTQVENETLLFQNILYEKNHLMNAIQSCRQLEVPHLFQMACDELGLDATTQVLEEGTETEYKDSVIDRFLAPPTAVEEGGGERGAPSSSSSSSSHGGLYSHRDVTRHSYNLSKMYSELTIRGTLHTQLLQAKKEKSALLKDLANKKNFLASIPQHVAKIEKGLNGCKEYFKKDSDVLENAVGLRLDAWMMGREEEEEGEEESSEDTSQQGGNNAAVLEELSAPLYTLYVQFVSFIEGSNGTLYDCNGWKVKIVDSKPWMVEGDVHDDNAKDNENVDTCNEKGVDAKYSQNVNALCDLQKEPKAVQLCIPIGAMIDGSERKDCVKIQFESLPKLNVVLAHVVHDKSLNCIWGGGGTYNTSKDNLLLLQNLFPYDEGRDLPPGADASAIYHSELLRESARSRIERDDEDDDVDKEDKDEEYDITQDKVVSAEQRAIWKLRHLFYTSCQYGRPYRWCQSLAGLHYPKSPSSSTATSTDPPELLIKCQIEATTRVVLQTLHRRIRSHCILSQLIKKLKSLPNLIPVHPSMMTIVENSGVENVSTKLSSFQLLQDHKSNTTTPCDWKVYTVGLKRKSKSFKAQVKIGAKYPVEPPVWSLQQATSQDNDAYAKERKKRKTMKPLVIDGTGIEDNMSLYDSDLGRIECNLNTLVEKHEYFNEKEEESYNWILMHQVRRLILEWDRLQKSLEVDAV
eukprot:CAMPEP_0176486456 /NCGR_PEP_ID=MMETSP0200_2-20121128/5576_1 /TAXON_ID=947934 /ORGANISM="Chaetoceros sp., Strain GSL56" /LENGTH=781 /DNA_ID=CAMNT_0017883155 /DNA_START=2516 /DNA_END=4861 /DNA_ORIENTATION=+